MRLGKNVAWSTLVAALVAAAGAIVMLFAAQGAMAGIAGSKHDFSTGNTWNTTGEICVVCHAPHNSGSSSLLWNHSTSAVATYTLYASPSLNATLGQPGLGGVSKLCLSCHDGTVAIDNFGGKTTGTQAIPATANLAGGTLGGTTGSLADDHPISFTYDAALATADGGLVTPVDAKSVVAGIPLYSAKLECASCHDVHNNAAAGTKLLRVANTSSALCLKCHNK